MTLRLKTMYRTWSVNLGKLRTSRPSPGQDTKKLFIKTSAVRSTTFSKLIFASGFDTTSCTIWPLLRGIPPEAVGLSRYSKILKKYILRTFGVIRHVLPKGMHLYKVCILEFHILGVQHPVIGPRHARYSAEYFIVMARARYPCLDQSARQTIPMFLIHPIRCPQ